MLVKARTESLELQILRILNLRMDLPEDKQRYYLNLEKGFLGEVQFDLLTEQLECDCLIINDLLLEVNNTKFQIDSLIIYQKSIYLFEVKNNEGDYCYEADSFKTKSGLEIKNPLDQLKRSTSLFRQLCHKLGSNLSVESFVVFVNPAFTLYQAPKNLPFIFPTQLKIFIEKLDSKPSRLNTWHSKFADQLKSLHIVESPYDRLSFYQYDQLEKGITCKECNSFYQPFSVHRFEIECNECGSRESVNDAILQNVREHILLFPDRKITTKTIHEWCQVIPSTKRIQRVLDYHYQKTQNNRWTYYK